jgi:hypothetical protein
MTESYAEIADLLRDYGPEQPDLGCPSWQSLDRWRLDELPEQENSALEEHMASCAACQLRLQQEHSAFALVPGGVAQLGASIRRDSSSKRRRLLRWPATLLMSAAAAGWLLYAVPTPGVPHVGTRDASASADAIVPKGGSHVRLNAFRKQLSKVDQLVSGATVSPGDQLRFAVAGVPNESEIMVVGVEASGRRFCYYPLDNTERSVRHDTGSGLLDGAAELDDSTGDESIVLVTCPHPFDLRSLTRGLPAECQTASLKINKARQ